MRRDTPQGRSRGPGPTGRRIDIVVLLVCALWALVMLAWSLSPGEAVQHKELVEALEKWGVMYLLVRNGYYEVARRYVGNHPELYRLILDRPGAREMLVQYIGGRGNVPAPGADGAQ